MNEEVSEGRNSKDSLLSITLNTQIFHSTASHPPTMSCSRAPSLPLPPSISVESLSRVEYPLAWARTVEEVFCIPLKSSRSLHCFNRLTSQGWVWSEESCSLSEELFWATQHRPLAASPQIGFRAQGGGGGTYSLTQSFTH